MAFGSMPNDGGYLLMNTQEKLELLAIEPNAASWVRQISGSDEFINGIERWCLWLIGIAPDKLRLMPAVMERVDSVRKQRMSSSRPTTRDLANMPTLFGEIRQPDKKYLAVPEVSSETRQFIPIGFLPSEHIATNKLYTISDASIYHFGVLSSTMHNAWMRTVGGRLKSDYQYSTGIVYNNFPWPQPSDNQIQSIEAAAQAVLDARTLYPSSTLADVYDPLTMPPELVKGHQKLDKAVDAAYGRTNFSTEAERVAFLFERYQELAAPLILQAMARKTREGKTA
jgi:hypothetical protein